MEGHRVENQWTKVKRDRSKWSEGQAKKEVSYLIHLVQELALPSNVRSMRRQQRLAAADERGQGKRKLHFLIHHRLFL